MGKKIRVTPEELEAASKNLLEFSNTYTDIYGQLMKETGTMGEAWESDDNVAFVNQINGFCEDLKAMASKLQTASDTLHQQKVNYSTRQETNITQVQKLAN